MGAVYRGVDERVGRPVAIKVIRRDLVEDPSLGERLEREARIAGALAHPHIVQTTDYGMDANGSPFIVMELLDGEPLSALLRREGRMPPMRVVAILDQMLDALSAAHRAGAVHRDLKPANVYVTRQAGGSESIKLLDFGIAKLKDGAAYRRLTATGQILGTPTWMAPEQARGDMVDDRVDIYAAALIAYRALAGRMPWVAESQAEMLIAIQDVAPAALVHVVSGLDPTLAALIHRAIEKRPADRFTSAAEMRAALAPWLRRVGPPPIMVANPTIDEHPTRARTAATVNARPNARPNAGTPNAGTPNAGTPNAGTPERPPSFAVVAQPSRRAKWNDGLMLMILVPLGLAFVLALVGFALGLFLASR
jgi:serine/threonine-protein kinase